MLILNYRQRLKIIQFCFLLTDVAYLGFCLRPKSSISDHWSSHRVKVRTGGYFEIESENGDKLTKGKCVMWAVL